MKGVHPALDAAAVEAIDRFRWAPAKRDGRPVAATIRVNIQFEMRGPR